MKTRTSFDRLSLKSLNGLMTAHFQQRYNLSPQAAKTICNDTVLLRNLFSRESRTEGQIIHYAVKLGEPASKPIKNCELIPVKLTLISSEDLEYQKKNDLQKLNLQVMERIAKQTYEQGAILSVEDVAFLLRISESTVKRYKRLLKASNREIILRGDSADMGPGVTHRLPVVQLYLQGYSETEIAQRLNHQLERVEEYIYDFLRVSLLFKDNYGLGMVARITKLSKSKVMAIKTLYDKLTTDSFYKEPLNKVLDIFELRRRFKKKGLNS